MKWRLQWPGSAFPLDPDAWPPPARRDWKCFLCGFCFPPPGRSWAAWRFPGSQGHLLLQRRGLFLALVLPWEALWKSWKRGVSGGAGCAMRRKRSQSQGAQGGTCECACVPCASTAARCRRQAGTALCSSPRGSVLGLPDCRGAVLCPHVPAAPCEADALPSPRACPCHRRLGPGVLNTPAAAPGV